MTASADVDRIGALVGGKYRIIRLLARGGMGVVYEAHHVVVRRRFAVKFLRRDLAQRRDILGRFQREAETAGALENENVTAAVDFGVSDDGAPYIVMEYLVGESLADLLAREGRLRLGRAADLVAQACRGVAAAHAAGIVHRDLKPRNLFVSRRDDGTDLLKVLDFGVAKLQALEDDGMATRTGNVLGTAAYMSPEQARGEKLVDQRADVYALGAILFELVSLKRPHPGESQNAILHHTATQPAIPLASLEPDLPPAFVAIVERALASDPAARLRSADAVARELAPFASRSVWSQRPDAAGPACAGTTPSVAGAHDAQSAPDVAPAAAQPTSAPVRAAPWWAGPVASAALLLLVIGLAVGHRRASVHAPAAPPMPSQVAPRVTEMTATAQRARSPNPPAASVEQAPSVASPPASPAVAGRPAGHKRTFAGRPGDRPPHASGTGGAGGGSAVEPPSASSPPEERHLLAPAFDSANPYK